MSRCKREYETTEYAAMMRRMVRRYGVRVGVADPVDLGEMLALRAELDEAIAHAVALQRRSYSWALIASGLGMSRQAVQQRWGSAVDRFSSSAA